MCTFSRIPHSCLASLGAILPGQTRRMLLTSYVLDNRCDLWLSALWHGFVLRQYMAKACLAGVHVSLTVPPALQVDIYERS